MKRTASTIVTVLSLFVSVSTAAETPPVSTPSQEAAGLPATVESAAGQVIESLLPAAPASDAAQAEETPAPEDKTTVGTVEATTEAAAQAATKTAPQEPNPAVETGQQAASSIATSESTTSANPGKPCPRHGKGGMHKGKGHHGMGHHGMGHHGKGKGHHGKGQGMHQRHAQVVQRLDMIEARLLKMEAMLESLMRR